MKKIFLILTVFLFSACSTKTKYIYVNKKVIIPKKLLTTKRIKTPPTINNKITKKDEEKIVKYIEFLYINLKDSNYKIKLIKELINKHNKDIK